MQIGMSSALLILVAVLLLCVVQVCMARSRPSGWHLRMAGVAGLSSAWQYTSCCSQQLGECERSSGLLC